MILSPLSRTGLYLFLSLGGALLGSAFPSPFYDLIHLFAVFLALLAERVLSEKKPTLPPFPEKKTASLLLLFPLFCFLTYAASLLSGTLTRAFGGALPTVSQTAAVFFGAVLIAPLAEELLFRHLVLRLLLPYGEGKAILLSSLLFGLAHASFFQLPYAIAAGLLLAFLAVKGGSFFYPLCFHMGYNLFAFFCASLSAEILFPILLGAALLFAILLCPLRPDLRLSRRKGEALPLSLPLLLYGAATITLAILRV